MLLIFIAGMFVVPPCILYLQQTLNLSNVAFVIALINSLLQSASFITPFSIFLLVYGEITIKLIIWCDSIRKDIILGRNHQILEKSKHFAKALHNISNLFSYFLFTIILSSLIGLIFTTYRSLSFFLGTYENNLESVLFSIGFFNCFVAYVVITWYLCSFSQLLTNKVQELKFSVLNLNVTKCILPNMNESEIIDEKESVYINLDEFKGYNAEDFFTVNNSLITGMTSNFVTYLIILIQFKFTELSLKEDSSNHNSLVNSSVNSTSMSI